MEIECYLVDKIIFKRIFEGSGLLVLKDLKFIPLEPISFTSKKGKEILDFQGKKLKITIEEVE